MAEKRRRPRKAKAQRSLILWGATALLLLAFLAVELLGGKGIGPTWNQLYKALGNEPITNADKVPPCGAAVHFIDVGQGDCVLLECDGQYAIIDSGDSDAWEHIRGYLDEMGVKRLELAFISHIHADHTGSMYRILREYPVGKVILPDMEKGPEPTTFSYEKILIAIEEEHMDWEIAAIGAEYPLGSGSVHILGNGIVTENQNDISTALRFDAGDLHFVTTGDGEKELEQALLEGGANLKANLFKAAHHGSSTSNSLPFLEAVHPELVVASCGIDNEYGHPHGETVAACETVGAKLLRTDRDGSVTVWFGENGLRYSTTREAEIQ